MILLAILGNSLTAFLAFLSGYFLFKPLRMIIPLTAGMIFLLNFLAGNFGSMTLFRKSPEVILSGTGRFEKYEECLSRIYQLLMGGEVCHGMYFTMLSRYGFFGMLELLLIFSGAVLYVFRIYGSRDLWSYFPIVSLIFITANDFIFNTPSSFTLIFVSS